MMKYRDRNRIFLLSTIALCIFCAVFVAARVRSDRRMIPICKDCNVVLISLDTLSANHLPCYGYKRDTATYLCSFAKKNILFKNMFANSNTTLPSHVSIFTGLYPSKHNVNLPNVDTLSPTTPFLPEILQHNGYQTHFYLTQDDPSNLPIDRVFYKGIDTITSADHPRDWKKGLDLLAANNAVGKKTFLFLHSYWVHSPYIFEKKDSDVFGESTTNKVIPSTWDVLTACTPAFISYLKDAVKEDLDYGYWGDRDDSIYMDLYEKLLQIDNFNTSQREELCANTRYNLTLSLYFRTYYSYLLSSAGVIDAQFVTDLYDSKIKELDGYIEDTVSHILDSDLKKNTIIMITSDHGEEFMEHGQWEHGKNLYDTSLKVPLILFVPGYSHAEMDILAQSVDILPTILQVLEIDGPRVGDGKDLFGDDVHDRIYAIAEKTTDSIKTIRDNRWKLFLKTKSEKGVPIELYDIISDPNERNNVIFLHPDIVKKLMDALSQMEQK